VLPYLLFKWKQKRFYKKWKTYREETKQKFLKDHDIKEGQTWEQLEKAKTNLTSRTDNETIETTKKQLLMDLEAEMIFMEQIEETRIMIPEMNTDLNYETLALTFGYCCFFSAAFPIVVVVM